MKGRFLLSTLDQFPKLKDSQGNLLPEIVLAGRSNSGKSSLINHLLKEKIAKASATPGKTQLLNFFLIDQKFILTDLPGYGFAKAPADAVQKWSQAVDHYLNSQANIRLLLLLIDIRREPNDLDYALIEWAFLKQIPLWVILTKTDKLSHTERSAQLKKAREMIRADILLYSVMEEEPRRVLEKRIEQFLWA